LELKHYALYGVGILSGIACSSDARYPYTENFEHYRVDMRCESGDGEAFRVALEDEGDRIGSKLSYRYHGTVLNEESGADDEAVIAILPEIEGSVDVLRFRFFGHASSELEYMAGSEINAVIDVELSAFSRSYFISLSDENGYPRLMAYTSGKHVYQPSDCFNPWFCPRIERLDDACSEESTDCGLMRLVGVRFEFAFEAFEIYAGSMIRYYDGGKEFNLKMSNAYSYGNTNCLDIVGSNVSALLLAGQ